MLDPAILIPAVLNGLTTGAIYALVALGLTLIYGVLHIINFAHGSLLMMAMYGVFFLNAILGLDPYLALPIMVPLFFGVGYVLQRWVIRPASHGKDENILLVTLGLAIILDNAALFLWTSTTRTIEVPYAFSVVDLGVALIAVPRGRRLLRGARHGRAAVVRHRPHRYRQGDPRRRPRAPGRPPRRHPRRPHLRDELRHRHGLPCRRRLPAAAEFLRDAAGRLQLRPHRLHHRRARRHGGASSAP